MPVIQHIDVLSLAKIGALFGLVMGIVWGIFYGMLAAAMLGRFTPGVGAIGGVAILIIMPVVGIVMGFIMGAVHAFLYNIFAGWVGGVRLEFKE